MHHKPLLPSTRFQYQYGVNYWCDMNDLTTNPACFKLES